MRYAILVIFGLFLAIFGLILAKNESKIAILTQNSPKMAQNRLKMRKIASAPGAGLKIALDGHF